MPSGGSKNQNYLPTGKFTDLLARRCASIFELRPSKTQSILVKFSILDFISRMMAPCMPRPSPWIFRTVLAQSLAILVACKPWSLARASPSRQAITSTTSASVFPSTTSAEAPKKLPTHHAPQQLMPNASNSWRLSHPRSSWPAQPAV